MILIYLGFGFICSGIVWGLIRVGLKAGLVSHPDHKFRRQIRPVPTLGGLGLVICLLLGTVLVHLGSARDLSEIGSLSVLALVSLVGLLDDRYEFTAFQKLLGQTLVASVIVANGYQLMFEGGAAISVVVSVLLLVWLQNAFNLVDVCDGLLATVSLVGFIGLELVGASSGVSFPVVCTAMIAFLLFNRPPARIYLGDAGSFLLAGVLYLYIIDYQKGGSAALNMLLLPLPLVAVSFEFTLLLYRRSRRRLPVYKASNDHYSILLQQAGWSKWKILLVTLLISVLWAGIFVAAYCSDDIGKSIAIIGMGITIIATVFWFDRFSTETGR